METPEEVLIKAASIVETDGWTQGQYFECRPPMPEPVSGEAYAELARTAPVCSVGALYRAVYGCSMGAPYHAVYGSASECGCDWSDLRLNGLFRQAEELLAKQVGGRNVITWNDREERTAEDVILAMKRAAHGE